ncbi:acetyltransferase [Patellaria atrata CBS 101060]|uniref:Acetyltransferase n=1 Tax=Patellaria atrata CBS 101060 TaxID=1346257 RepID=A0A9P4S6Q6_9PEZI|nr:acetyltransferase [Patellaria atrata CBS 101060]
MPRDLETEKDTLSNMPPLTTANHITNEPEEMYGVNGIREHEDKIQADMRQRSTRDGLHPYVQVLTINNLDSCIALEEASFPPNQRATREKFEYRLTVCGEICLGLFTSAEPDSENTDQPTSEGAHPVDSSSPERKQTLVAHIISTKCEGKTVGDNDMKPPENWRTAPGTEPHLGHKDHGRTIALHSLAVLPKYQRCGLGKTLIRAYLHRMEQSGVADRVSLITYDRLVPYYESLGFENLGPSKAQFGGQAWNDMVYEFYDSPSSPS